MMFFILVKLHIIVMLFQCRVAVLALLLVLND
jgi:hypothetical protein